jgi:hypothetical protein
VSTKGDRREGQRGAQADRSRRVRPFRLRLP